MPLELQLDVVGGDKSLRAGPEHLDTLRIKIDGSQSHWVSSGTLREFLDNYGQYTVRIFLWFEACPLEAYQGVAAGFRFTPSLHQLELFLPSLEEDSEDMQDILNEMCSRRRPVTVNYRGWFNLGVDRAEFWEAPSCTAGSVRCAPLLVLHALVHPSGACGVNFDPLSSDPPPLPHPFPSIRLSLRVPILIHRVFHSALLRLSS
ncbi:hypothetical protein FA13DRAFT_1797900 [Coprinellus micaceus]|uniref:Uncharacterized protein n=1 Tax=Coprinellus micaceus TaxID=71717 RepID=A0A4Y7SNX3_COPMI|nr:hypothetical protein FA13DRAFT_1797900 [Coprinellus micaceus]